MKATFNFNVQIDGSKSVITMDGDNIKDLDMVWTEFGGLIREYTEIRFANNKMESAFEFKRKTLFHYECGILF